MSTLPTINFNVAGVTFEGRDKFIATMKGTEPVALAAQPQNQFDPEAVGVLVNWDTENPFQVGFVPKPLNKVILCLFQNGIRFSEKITSCGLYSGKPYVSIEITILKK